MKNLITSIFLILLSFSLSSQINYSVGIGPQYNFGKITAEQLYENDGNFSFFGKGEVYFSKNKMNYRLSAQFNQTRWAQKIQNSNSGFRNDFSFMTFYLNINPTIEFKPIKQIGVLSGVYGGFNLQEFMYVQTSDTWIRASGFNITNLYDFGLSLGINAYLFQNYSIELKTNLGLNNIRKGSDLSFTDNDGNIINNTSLKNQNIQLSFNYHFYDF